MRKLLTPVIIGLTAFIILSFGLKDDPDNNSPNQTATVDSKQMDKNNIRTWYRNNGNFNRDPVTRNAGFEWPKVRKRLQGMLRDYG